MAGIGAFEPSRSGGCIRTDAPYLPFAIPIWIGHLGGYLPLARGVSTVRCPIPQRTFKYVATVSANTSPVSRGRAHAREAAGNQRPWPADKVERWAIDRLIPYAKNARTHSDAQIAAIAASIKRLLTGRGSRNFPSFAGGSGGIPEVQRA